MTDFPRSPFAFRQSFRHFRTDRIAALDPTGARYPRRRHVLIREWRAGLGVPEPLWPCHPAADGTCHQTRAKLRVQA
ncbi:MAG: hypothetical protein ACREE1_08025 [Stellaceae bacterium]